MSWSDILCVEAASGRDLPTATLAANNIDSAEPACSASRDRRFGPCQAKDLLLMMSSIFAQDIARRDGRYTRGHVSGEYQDEIRDTGCARADGRPKKGA